jgi:hypothetical protein
LVCLYSYGWLRVIEQHYVCHQILTKKIELLQITKNSLAACFHCQFK